MVGGFAGGVGVETVGGGGGGGRGGENVLGDLAMGWVGEVVERKLAALEGGESALLFSTGMSALVGLLLAKLNSATK